MRTEQIATGLLLAVMIASSGFAAQDIPDSWLSQVQNDIAASEYNITLQSDAAPSTLGGEGRGEETSSCPDSTRGDLLPPSPLLRGDQGGITGFYQAPNRKQNLRTYFTDSGIRVVRRTETNPSWEWGLELVGCTKDEGGRMRDELGNAPIPPVEGRKATGNRFEFNRGNVTEWYVNSPEGLEQGFTINQPQSLKDTKDSDN
ncbi:MAG TPA: hypothetical protein PKH07_09050, partial [bacterium]|nr:hypothetical protein [bacterium]